MRVRAGKIQKRWLEVLSISALAALLLPGGESLAQQNFPGSSPSRNTITIQQKAERLYREGDYERAFGIFLNELAPIGDKYAQYMVGYMYLVGEGVEPDLTKAYGWYLLAAERAHEPLLMAMRELEAQLTEEERGAGMAEYEELKGRIGDRALVRRLIRMDERRLGDRTGRVGASVGSPTTVVLRDGRTVDATKYYRAIERRIERRLSYLEGYVEFGELEVIPDELDGEGRGGAATSDAASAAEPAVSE